MVKRDFYQDTFGEGSFYGKGIYDVERFSERLSGRIPDNTVLSHDLLEGCYVGCAKATDLELYEECPRSYIAESRRRGRWIRGDLQLWPWLLPYVRNARGHWTRNTLSVLSRWKIVDNMRRAFVPIASVAFSAGAWLSDSTLASKLLLPPAILVAPGLVSSALAAYLYPEGKGHKQFFQESFASVPHICVRLTFQIADSICVMRALGAVLWRSLVSRTHLLQWDPFNETNVASNGMANFALLWPSSFLALGFGGYLAFAAPETLAVAAPTLGFWLFAPATACWLARPLS